MEIARRLMLGQLYAAQETGIIKVQASKCLKTYFGALAKSQALYLIM